MYYSLSYFNKLDEKKQISLKSAFRRSAEKEAYSLLSTLSDFDPLCGAAIIDDENSVIVLEKAFDIIPAMG